MLFARGADIRVGAGGDGGVWPSAEPSLAMVEMGIRSTSLYTCIRNWFLSSPPATMNSVTGTPPAANVSIRRVPNVVDSSSAR